MKEVQPDSHWVEERDLPPQPELVGGGTPDWALIMITLLMRNYDVNMAILNELNQEVADTVYDKHNSGGDFNPALYVLQLQDQDEGSTEALPGVES